jgi:hypothetical protein
MGDREISRHGCGCTVQVPEGKRADLHLCAWHSRWITSAGRVVLAGKVQDVEVKATFTAEPGTSATRGRPS